MGLRVGIGKMRIKMINIKMKIVIIKGETIISMQLITNQKIIRRLKYEI